MPIESTIQYLKTESSVTFPGRVCATVEDRRPAIEKGDYSDDKTKSELMFYQYTGVGLNPQVVSNLFRRNLTDSILDKKMASDAYACGDGEITEGTTVLKVKLLHWYGKIPVKEFDITNLLVKPTRVGEGSCRFSVSMIKEKNEQSIGEFKGSFWVEINEDATVEKEGSTVSGFAADRAIAQFLKTCEHQLSKK